LETFFVSKVSIVYLHSIMRDKIVEKSRELFVTLGFKSVTMDDIANNLGISKKTLYVHFKNKTALVKEVTLTVIGYITNGINQICIKEENPIKEIFEIKNFVMEYLKDEKSAPQYQLQKYYPSIYATLKQQQFELMEDCVKGNLTKGIQLGLYRKDISIEFASRIYFHGVIGVKDKDLFPTSLFPTNELMVSYLDYHLRGICSNKGIEFLENQLKKNH